MTRDLPDPREALEALHALDPSMPREDWFKVCCAFKAAGGTEKQFIEWSSHGQNFDLADARSTWRSVKPKQGGVTELTLWAMARARGWKPRALRGNGSDKRTDHAKPKLSASKRRETGARPRDVHWVWSTSQLATPRHGYLKHKGLEPHGTHVLGGRMVVPYYNAQRQLQTVQFIAPEPDSSGKFAKRFLKDCPQKGSVALVGEPIGAEVVCVAEGWATAAAIYEATSIPVVVAGSRGLLPDAARMARGFAPEARVIICADCGDMAMPTVAARAVAGFVCVPGDELAADGYDFCDWRKHGASTLEIRTRHSHRLPSPHP